MNLSDTFYVKDNAGNLVAAKFLQYEGQGIVDPNPQTFQIFTKDDSGNLVSQKNTNNWLVVPADFPMLCHFRGRQ